MRHFPAEFAVFLWCATSAVCATIAPLTFQQLVEQSDLIVRGHVVSSSVEWSASHRFLWTRYKFAVDERVSGQAANTITVSEPGGRLGGIDMQVPGAVAYAPGEHATLFLRRFPSGDLRTVGWGYGKLSEDSAGHLHPAAALGLPGALTSRELRDRVQAAQRSRP